MRAFVYSKQLQATQCTLNNADETVGREARRLKVSHAEARTMALAEVR